MINSSLRPDEGLKHNSIAQNAYGLDGILGLTVWDWSR